MMMTKKETNYGLFYSPTIVVGNHNDAYQIYQGIEKQTLLAESYGWGNVWLAEHHGVPFGGVINSPEIFGAYLAAKTSTIRIGPAICVLPLHNPWIIAERYAMLDQLSAGRLDMGVGRGFVPSEFELMGVSMEGSKSRFAESLELIDRIWREGHGSHHGDHYSFEDRLLYPSACQRPAPPIWVAASKAKTSFELAGTCGHHLMINPYTRTKEEIEEGIKWYHDALYRSGYNPSKKKVAAIQHLFIGDIDDQLKRAFNQYVQTLTHSVRKKSVATDDKWCDHFAAIDFNQVYPEKVMFGGPGHIAEKIDRWTSIGITNFCFLVQFGSLPWEAGMESIQRIHEEV